MLEIIHTVYTNSTGTRLMARELPPFETVTHHELRGLWQQYQSDDIRRLILEVVRYRQVMRDIDRLYKITHQAWREQEGGNLTALHMLQQIMTIERQRHP